ncbi:MULTISPECIES: DUF1850 domain-containing protein [unclassified Virgibacillus]|uniref:DUF1850 domain-containing protein n=1 Tax=unclassified Virgibacillus TaxID=2620237 RepID=UPI0024DE4188|nr:DUF1850 domain-containing protein [Virgibacillus sp. LDC-1]
MKLQQKHVRLTAISLLTLIIIIGALFVPFRTALVFYKENSNSIIAYLPLKEGGNFQIVWKHSIHLTDVVEKYQILPDHSMKQYEIIYEHFGIGMPSNAENGEEFVYEDGKYHIKNLNNIFPSFVLRNGKTVSNHRLRWGRNGQSEIQFNDYFRPGGFYKLKVDNLSLWQLMKGVKIHE